MSTYDARKDEQTPDQINARFHDVELRDALDQIDEATTAMAGHFLDHDPAEVARKIDVRDMRVLILRLVWSAEQAREHYEGMFERARQLSVLVAEHEGCDK